MGWQTFTPEIYPEFDMDQDMQHDSRARGSNDPAPTPIPENRGTKRAGEDLPAQEGNDDTSDGMILSIIDGRGQKTGQSGRSFIK